MDEQQLARAATRRSLLRAGVHSAWAVPTIAIATAAPAAAVGSPVGSLVVSQAAYSPGLIGLGASMTFTVCNNGTVDFVSPIVLTVQVPPISLGALPGVSGTGWSITSSLLDLANLGTITLVYSAPLAAGVCAPQVKLQFLIGVSLGSGRSATASGTDSYGHKVSSPTKSF